MSDDERTCDFILNSDEEGPHRCGQPADFYVGKFAVCDEHKAEVEG